MVVGIPAEIKEDEYRVALTPVGAEVLTQRGHTVLVERDAGIGSGISNEDYSANGAEILDSKEEIYGRAELIVKVKEPLPEEYPLLREGQVVFCYFHFAADRGFTDAVMRSGIVAIAYETVRTNDGKHPLLTPMSEIAGRMAIQEGAKALEKPMMGKGILLGGVPGVPPAEVLIIGAGVVGTNAAKVSAGLGARVTVMDINLDRLRYVDDIMPGNVVTVFSDPHRIRDALPRADLVVGAVLVEGARAPVLITREMLRSMRPGSVIVDVAIDQGGCTETSRPTTHSEPVFVEEGVVHYCVTNMPGAVGATSTYALTNVTLPYIVELADKGYERACTENIALRRGLNIVKGEIVNRAVADSHGLPWTEFGGRD